MSLDEFLYNKYTRFLNKKKSEKDRINKNTVWLNDVKDKLTILASAICGQSIIIYQAEREGGYKNNSFFLPEKFDWFENFELNKRLYIFRVLYISIQKINKINNLINKDTSLEDSLSISRIQSIQTLNIMFDMFPGIKNDYYIFNQKCIEQYGENNNFWLLGKLFIDNETHEMLAKNELHKPLKNKIKNEIKTVLKAKAVEEINILNVDTKAQEDYVLTHNFEKVETAEEFDGVWRDFDGDDELKKQQDAVQELKMKYAVRVDDTVHSMIQAEFIENSSIPFFEQKNYNDNKAIYYPEWDYRNLKYKNDFCALYEYQLNTIDTKYYNQVLSKNQTKILQIKKMMTSIYNKRKEVSHMNHGDNFDLDSLIDLWVDIKNKHITNDNIYISNLKKENDMAVLLLLDLSLSSDGYTNEQRIIDVEKEITIILGEILNDLNIPFSIGGFNSNTRNNSTYINVKPFATKWDQSKYYIGSLEPEGYTRIGTSLRHAHKILDEFDSKNKWLILLTDGKPNDYDKYEGKYGKEDVKKAITELKSNHINTFAFAIDSTAKYYLPEIFGKDRFQILSSSTSIVQNMAILIDKIRKYC